MTTHTTNVKQSSFINVILCTVHFRVNDVTAEDVYSRQIEPLVTSRKLATLLTHEIPLALVKANIETPKTCLGNSGEW